MLPTLAQIANSKGLNQIVEEIVDLLIDRLSTQEYRKDSIPPATEAFLDTLPFNGSHSVRRVVDYVIQFRDLGFTQSLFKTYSRRLLDLHRKDKIEALLSHDLSMAEEQAVLNECARYGFNNKAEDISVYFNGKHSLPVPCLLYEALRHKRMHLGALPGTNDFPATIREYDPDEHDRWKRLFRDNFFTAVIYGLDGKQEAIQQWIVNTPPVWSARAMSCLFTAGLQIASGIQSSKIGYADLFHCLTGLEQLEWPEDRESAGADKWIDFYC